MKYSNAAVQQNDAKLVSKTLLKLATPRIIMRAVVIIVTIILWLWVATRILEFGAMQDYAFLNKFNAQLVSFLQSINPYLWWAVVLLGTLIVYFFLSAWYSGSVERAAYKTVPSDTAAELIRSLSPEGRDVLGWVWRDRTEPINIGNLKTTKDELDNNRVSKLAQIREQERLLGPATAIAADDRLAATIAASPGAQNEYPAPAAALRREPDVSAPSRQASQARAAAPVAASASAAVAANVVAEPVVPQEPTVVSDPPLAATSREPSAENPVAAEPGVQPDPDPAAPARNEPVIALDESDERTTVSTSEQTEPTIGRPDDTHLRPPRDGVKHTIT